MAALLGELDTWQRLTFGTSAWASAYFAGRSVVENLFGRLKENQALAIGTCQAFGLAANTIAVLARVVVYNIHKAAVDGGRGIPLRPSLAFGSAHRRSVGGWFRDGCGGSLGARHQNERSGLDGVRWLRVDFAVVTVWLTLAGVLSAWAFQRANRWWPLLTAVGVPLSVVMAAELVVRAVAWLLVNFHNLIAGKQNGGGKQG